MSSDTFADILVLAAVVPATLTPILYTLLPWYRSTVGRVMMIQAIGLAGVVDLSAAYNFIGNDYSGRDVIRILVYAFVLTGLWGVLFLQLSARQRAQGSKEEGLPL